MKPVSGVGSMSTVDENRTRRQSFDPNVDAPMFDLTRDVHSHICNVAMSTPMYD